MCRSLTHRAINKRRFRKFGERELNDNLRSIADLKAAAGKQTGIEGVTGVTDIPSEESQPTKRRCEVDDSKSKEMPPKIFGQETIQGKHDERHQRGVLHAPIKNHVSFKSGKLTRIESFKANNLPTAENSTAGKRPGGGDHTCDIIYENVGSDRDTFINEN